jgi:hypothetical protein
VTNLELTYRKKMINSENKELSITMQCEIMGINFIYAQYAACRIFFDPESSSGLRIKAL